MSKAVLLLAMIASMLVMASGVAFAASIACNGGLCRGTNNPDTIRASNNFRDFDKMYGKRGGDLMYGQDGADTISGDYGRDTIYGQRASDIIYEGFDDDRLFGGDGLDTVKGGPGRDYINVAGDGRADSVDCGTGRDTVVVDDADLGQATVIDFFRATSCENVIVR